MAPIADERYVSLTTFTRDGRPKPAPVWIADLGDGRLGFTTASSSWKVRRLRNTPDVTLQPCDARGNVRDGTEVTEATAEAVHGTEFERVRSRIKAKYGMQFRAINAWGTLARLVGKGSGTDTAVLITPRS